MLKWSQETLSIQSGVSISTIRDFESERRNPIPSNKMALRTAFEKAGLSFLHVRPGEHGPGVCMKWTAMRDGS
jgi:transcriptional regulator with XRE-family HTH domain